MCIWGLYGSQITKIIEIDEQSAENTQISVVKNIAGHALKASRWQGFFNNIRSQDDQDGA